MKYAATDLETLGVERKTPDHIIQLSTVVEDTNNVLPLDQLPHFTVFVAHPRYDGEEYALWMNGWIFEQISAWRKGKPTKYPVFEGTDWVGPYVDFLDKHFGKGNRVIMAGKNAGSFDLQFFPTELQKRFEVGVLDPGPIFTDFKNDKKIPSLDQIKSKIGLGAARKSNNHDALEDNYLVIQALRTRYT